MVIGVTTVIPDRWRLLPEIPDTDGKTEEDKVRIPKTTETFYRG